MAKPEGTLVIGLGRFGQSLATTLVKLGSEVLGIDSAAHRVQECTEELTHVVQADATDAEALRQIGARDFGTAVVAIGNDIQASILATYALVDLGVPRIWAKAITREHGEILRRVGAHHVVFPERDMGERVAHTMIGRTIDYVELDDGFALVETTPPAAMVGKTLAEAEVRGRYAVTVVCVKPPGGRFTYATADTRVGKDDLVVVAGEIHAVGEFAELD